MSDAFIGEIRMFGGYFAPLHWAFCNGQALAINDQQALFSLIGTKFGGNGRTSFALPDLRGRLPVHQGTGPGLTPLQVGQSYGTETVTLTVNQIPAHNHNFVASTSAATMDEPTNAIPAATNVDFYAPKPASADAVTLGDNAIQKEGTGLAHENRMPALTVSFIMCLQGIYPSRN